MNIILSRNTSIPLNEQLRSQIEVLIDTGKLNEGEQLPTVKELAKSLNLNYNTVAATYRALERDGYLEQNRRAGTKVATNPPKNTEQALAAHLSAAFAERLTTLGLDLNETIKLVAAHASLRREQQPLQVAVLGQTPLEAARASERTQAILGEQVRCVPQLPETYQSTDYHLTVINPALITKLTASPKVTLEPPDYYGPDFPAGAD